MSGFTKLSRSILLSTVWRESHETVRVWITLLALVDNPDGYVFASLPGLADEARVTLEQCKAALACFLSPDEYSRSKEYDGRRIEEVDGGWQILNYAKYRDGRDPEARRRQNRDAQARHRSRKPKSAKVSPRKPRSSAGKPKSAQAETEAESETDEAEAAASASTPIRFPITAVWQPAPETLASFRVGLIPDWAVPELVGRFRAHFAANKQDLSTDVEWNQRCSKWAFRDWGNPSKRPVKPAANTATNDAEGWA